MNRRWRLVVVATAACFACSLDTEGGSIFGEAPDDAGSDTTSDAAFDVPSSDQSSDGEDVQADEGRTSPDQLVEDALPDQFSEDAPDASYGDTGTEDAPEDVLADQADVTDAAADDVQADQAADVQQDAAGDVGPFDVASDPPKHDCITTGVRVRMDADNGKTISQAGAAVGDPAAFTQGVCRAADDKDPSPSSFECCLTTSPTGPVKVWLDFVFSDNTHACTSTASGCNPLTQYTIWFNGSQVPAANLSNNYLPSCMNPGCQWYVYTGP